MSQLNSKSTIGLAAKLGSILFLVWSVLHIYVGIAGILAFFGGTTDTQFQMLFSGTNAPWSAIHLPTDGVTRNALSHLFGNFVVDVGGYGILGLLVSWLIFKQGSWLGYFLGVFLIGISDLAFTLFMVVPGIISFNWESISGPVIWLIAVILTPFGLPRRRAS